MHGLGAERLPKLADELLAQELNLLRTLDFDALEFHIGLRAQLFGDLLGVMPRLVDRLGRAWPIPWAGSALASSSALACCLSASPTFCAASECSSSWLRTVSCWFF